MKMQKNKCHTKRAIIQPLSRDGDGILQAKFFVALISMHVPCMLIG